MDEPLGTIALFYPYDAHAVEQMLGRARDVPDGVIILRGDNGGVIFVVAQARHVGCSAEALIDLVLDLDAAILSENTAPETSILLESLPVGGFVDGGMGGAPVTDGVWVHRGFDELALALEIKDVLDGKRPRLAARVQELYVALVADSEVIDDPNYQFHDKVQPVRVFDSQAEARREVARLNAAGYSPYFYFLKPARMRVDRDV